MPGEECLQMPPAFRLVYNVALAIQGVWPAMPGNEGEQCQAAIDSIQAAGIQQHGLVRTRSVGSCVR